MSTPDDTITQNGRTFRTVERKSSKHVYAYRNGSNYKGFNASEDTELIMGSVLGVRGWNRDSYGRLTPVHNGTEPFKPGENLATCNTVYDAKGRRTGIIRDHNMYECACGYYAYFSHHARDSNLGEVQGIIEGTGITVVGKEGFRVEKAVLRALIAPNRIFSGGGNGFRWFNWISKWVLPSFNRAKNSRLYDSEYDWSLSMILVWAASVFGIVMGVVGVSNWSPTYWLLIVGSVLVAFYGIIWARYAEAQYAMRKKTLNSMLRGGKYETKITRRDGDPNDPNSLARLKLLYPDVEIFPSLRAARAKFPLSSAQDFKRPDPPLPSPVNTDNFWSLK